jgi:hypothetical protein
MLSGAFGAFCAWAAENPSGRSAIEAKTDSVLIGDFMIDLSLALVRGCRSLANPFRAPGVFGSSRLTTYITATKSRTSPHVGDEPLTDIGLPGMDVNLTTIQFEKLNHLLSENRWLFLGYVVSAIFDDPAADIFAKRLHRYRARHHGLRQGRESVFPLLRLNFDRSGRSVLILAAPSPFQELSIKFFNVFI